MNIFLYKHYLGRPVPLSWLIGKHFQSHRNKLQIKTINDNESNMQESFIQRRETTENIYKQNQ